MEPIQNDINIGDEIILIDPSYTIHRRFEWKTGMVVGFSNDEDEVNIVSIIDGKEKYFNEFTDSVKKVTNEN